MVAASLAMAAALWAVARALEGPFASGLGLKVGALLALVAVGMLVYFSAARLLGAFRFAEARALFRRPARATAAEPD